MYGSSCIRDICRRFVYGLAVCYMLALVACSTYDEVNPISHVAVQRADGTWTLVDNKGDEVKNAAFKNPPTFVSGDRFARLVSEHEGVQIFDTDLDRKGEENLIAVGHLQEGCIPVVKAGGRVNVLKPSGGIRFELTEIENSPVLAAAHSYQDGLLRVSTAACKAYYVDEDGKVVTDRKPINTVNQRGKVFRQNNLYGVMDDNGAELIAPKYSYVQSSPTAWICTLPSGKGTELITVTGNGVQSRKFDYKQVYYIDSFGYVALANEGVCVLDEEFKPVSQTRYKQVSAAKQCGVLLSKYVDAEPVISSLFETLQGSVFDDVKGCLGFSPDRIETVSSQGVKKYNFKQKTVSRELPGSLNDKYSIQASLYFTKPVVKKDKPDYGGDDEEEDASVKVQKLFNTSSRMYAYGLRVEFEGDNATDIAHQLLEYISDKLGSGIKGGDRVGYVVANGKIYVVQVLSSRVLRLLCLKEGDTKALAALEKEVSKPMRRYTRYVRPTRF